MRVLNDSVVREARLSDGEMAEVESEQRIDRQAARGTLPPRS